MKRSLDDEFLFACKNDYLEEIKEFLDKGANIESRDKLNWCAIHNTARYGYTEATKLLIERKANVNSLVGDWGALHFASCYNHLGVVELLLQSKEVKITKDNEGQTPITIAQNSNNSKLLDLFSKYIDNETNDVKKMDLNNQNNNKEEKDVNRNDDKNSNTEIGVNNKLIDFFEKQLEYFKGIIEKQNTTIQNQQNKIDELQNKLFVVTIENQKRIIDQQNEKIKQLMMTKEDK
eukprot:TRINITY_DN5953_c0_g1_i2.p1 TRINITY_DN5953_c0_g1~~TRINITY_DN5953_c0_g1_i2.p1  ORF type:complete len:234 (+),score=61.02 TRINITY_DN5953_c0_g1_i2:559-1260(+)